MRRRRAVLTLGALAVALAPVAAAAQGRVGRAPPATTGVTLPSPPAGTMHGAPTAPPAPWRVPWGVRRFGDGWSYPIVVGTPYQVAAPAPAPWPVPYYYPVPVPAVRRADPPKPAPPPYNPAEARMVTVGGGRDGGGGVMRIARAAGDTLDLTWLGTTRPIRSATLFVADADRQSLRSRAVDASHREARFALAPLERAAAFAGLTVVFADGSTQTTLVPLEKPRP